MDWITTDFKMWYLQQNQKQTRFDHMETDFDSCDDKPKYRH
jgi:hypothetical protein